jgi:hypothetical protein
MFNDRVMTFQKFFKNIFARIEWIYQIPHIITR